MNRTFFPFVVGSLVCALGASACSPKAEQVVVADAGDAGSATKPDAADAAVSLHSISGKIALVADADGKTVTFGTQNGSTVAVPIADIAGKTFYWATTPGGDTPGNATPLDQGAGVMGADLTGTFTTTAKYADGPWELVCLISVSGKLPTSGPSPGDLAAFDLTDPPAGEPPVTGQSVRLRIKGGDAQLTLNNANFIRFGGQ